MAKKQTTPRPARTPREVLQPKVAPEASSGSGPGQPLSAPRSGPGQPLGVEAIAAMSPEQLATRAAELDTARAALKAAGDAAAVAQAALDVLPNDATDEQRNDVLNKLEDAENAVKAAEAKLKELTNVEGTTGEAASQATAGAAADPADAPATNSTHNPPESTDQGGAGNGAGPAAGEHAPLEAGVLVVTTKRPSRWRAGRQFTKGGETRIPMVDLTEAQFRAISEDPVLESHVEPS